MPPTLRDVAAKVKLSPSLVSGVLNERPGIWASQETRQRVLLAARELNYRPHSAARALRSGKTQNVALVYVAPDQPHHQTGYSSVMEALARFLYAHGYQLLVQPLATQADALAHLREMARTRACDVVVLWDTESNVEEQGLLLTRMGMPFAVKGRHEERHPDWPQVEFDHEAMMAGAVDLLAKEHGRTRFAFIGYGSGAVYETRFLDGFHAAARAATGRPVPPHFVLSTDTFPDAVFERAAAWLDLPEAVRPNAVILGAGRAWEPLEIALARRGVRIGHAPGEMAVAGTSSGPVKLLFGNAHCSRGTDFFELAEAMCWRLVLPLMRGDPLELPVLRVCPVLHPATSLRLSEQGLAGFPSPLPFIKGEDS